MALYMAPAPVEEKGYKSMINLPDWISVSYLMANFKNRLKTGEFSSCPVLLADKKMVLNWNGWKLQIQILSKAATVHTDMLNMVCLNGHEIFLSLKKTPD